ncbi:double-strand break repair protein AddB [Sphingomonas panacisoli]|uniref:Double-strand break repair protein AddB n=1 Tax=Sphingomonas panacisoli TaxID=1813879 RepID=A0A5B8LHS3_9SPHN|nr:double-strand break repair protein AddB [Sphingomonas panacisoli]QDZ07419.1 double-strand break repair protein AddB [Sphingomonas panacisoli]
MLERLALYTIPAQRAFADSLVAGLMKRYGDDPLRLARGIVLLPNNRGRRAVQDAFVRASGGGLLLPRLVTIGDPSLDEAAGAMLDPADGDTPLPPAVDPLARRMILARLVGEARRRAGDPVTADEAVRLAGALARTLDQLLVEEVDPRKLRAIELTEALSEHWDRAREMFELVIERWPAELARIGAIDAADRRARMLRRLAARWKDAPPSGFVCAAGISDPAPAVAALLRCVAGLANGTVIFQDLALEMPEEEWDALGPHKPDPDTGSRTRSVETHPQFQLKLLLDRIGAGRGEVRQWPAGSDHDASLARGRAIANALAPADFTGKWTTLDADRRRLAGIRAVELATVADEAQAIALTLREALETPGRTAALVTPDRALAERVAAHCARWDIAIDDTAGRPLATRAPGTLLTVLAEAAAQDFAPQALLALLKHPLVQNGPPRTLWLDGVRALDRALRGPRPAPGLNGVDAHLREGDEREADIRAAALLIWPDIRSLLEPIEKCFGGGEQPLAAMIAALRETAQALCGDMLWAGPAGRAAAELLADLEVEAANGPPTADPASVAPLLRTLMEEIAVRPPQGGHPRLAIYGLIEARLQTADLMILGGLNEGTWPAIAQPDPWLAPRIRAELGLPGLERNVGVAAHDFANALGAPQVLITRARRDGRSPTLASRFWLRLEALAGERFDYAPDLADWAIALDDPGEHIPADRPAPSPETVDRPHRISVTEVDTLKADPFAFYARKVLKVSPIDPVDADPSPAWRGNQVHAILQDWFEQDGAAPDALRPRVEKLLNDPRTHPMIRALWGPRLREAIDWVASEVGSRSGERHILAVEGRGVLDLFGVELNGRFDRIDRHDDGSLIVVDYKTGQPPSIAAVREGFSLQLGLLGLIAERGKFAGVTGTATGFEYWSLARNYRTGGFGYVESPCDPKKRDPIPADEFVARATRNFEKAAGKWLTGAEPFTAKLRPEYDNYADYDQLMRRDEWYGRE